MKDSIDKRLKEIVKKYALVKISKEFVYEGTNLINDFGFSSVTVVQLIIDIENHFEIIIEDEDMDMELLTNYCSLREIIIRKRDKLEKVY